MTPQELDEARILHIASPMLLPLLKEKQQVAYDRLISKFRNEGIADLGLVAACEAHTSILEEIHYKLTSFEEYSKKEKK